MRAQVSKWGNSLAVRLPRAVVESLHIRDGEQVELVLLDDRLELRPSRPRYRLHDLIEQITPDNQPAPLDVPPRGHEAL